VGYRSVIAIVLASTGCGARTASKPPTDMTVNVEMTSFAFAPSEIRVRSGATIRFKFHNPTNVVHEAFIGDQAAQDAHDAEKARTGRVTAPTGPRDPGQVDVAPHTTEAVAYSFQEPERLILGCHEPGHYAAGMKATIIVT
jgi:uncharacterized cupredoxin-like copper-binding protein